MRARRAGTAPRVRLNRGSAWEPGAAGARRRWARWYRALRRAQPGLAPRRQTRPNRRSRFRPQVEPSPPRWSHLETRTRGGLSYEFDSNLKPLPDGYMRSDEIRAA